MEEGGINRRGSCTEHSDERHRHGYLGHRDQFRFAYETLSGNGASFQRRLLANQASTNNDSTTLVGPRAIALGMPGNLLVRRGSDLV